MNPLDRSQHKPAARTQADFPPCHIPARPSSEKPGVWSCRCWSCSGWISHDTAPLAAEPWRYHVCAACWGSLSVNQRIELAFRLSSAAEGGIGAPQLLNKAVERLEEIAAEIKRTCRGFDVWLVEGAEMWRNSLSLAEKEAAERERLERELRGEDGNADDGNDAGGRGSPGDGLGEGPANDSSDIDDADWWKPK